MDTRILIADSQWLVRQGLRSTLERLPGCTVIGEAATVADAVLKAVDLAPDVVVIDLHLPQEGGLEALRQVRERCPRLVVLMLGDESSLGSVREALRAGCGAYLRKSADKIDLFQEAVEKLRSGQIYLDAELTRQLVLQDHRREVAAEGGPLERLSGRELAVFKLIGAGYTNRAAAEQIQLSPKTVEKYRASVMQKLRLRNAFELRQLAQSLSEGRADAVSR